MAHIVTFGQMAPKSAIKDVSRAVGMSIGDANRLASFVPDVPRMIFRRAYKESKELRDVRECGSDLEKSVLRIAEKLEGCIRQPGVHACGIVVSRRPLAEVLPVTPIDEYWGTPNGIELITQYDGRCVEQVGYGTISAMIRWHEKRAAVASCGHRPGLRPEPCSETQCAHVTTGRESGTAVCGGSGASPPVDVKMMPVA